MLSATNIVFCIQIALGVIVIAVLSARRIHKKIPIFFCYIIYSISATAIQWAVSGNPRLYYKVYWTTEAADIILAVSATCESFISTFRGVLMAVRWFRFLVPTVAAIVAFYASWKAWSHPPVLNSTVAALVIGLEIGLRYFITGAFLCYVACRKFLDISHSYLQYSVIAGFFIASCGMLGAALVRSEFGTRYPLIMQWAAPVGYSLALMVWLFASLTSVEDANEEIIQPITAGQALRELELYESTLKKAAR